MRNLRLVHSNNWFEHSPAARDAADAGGMPSPHPMRDDVERALPALDPAVRAMVEHVRVVAPLPQVVRARALARARAVIAALQG